jgi:hypothetical protein
MSVVRGKAPWIAVGVGVVIVVVLGLTQLALPGIAAQRVRDQVGKYGAVRSAHVSAFPAIQLLWGSAQSATVSAGSLRMSFSQGAQLMSDARGIDRLDMTAESLRIGPLGLRHAAIHKRGSAVQIEGDVALSSLQAILPPGIEVQVVGSENGEVQMRLHGSLLGLSASLPAVISAQEGKLVVQTQGLPPFGGTATITLFSDPRLPMQGLEMTAIGSDVYRLKMSATLP